MELRHLRYFVAVAERLNFTRAAAKLHLAQPSLTRQIHNLEEELGICLLNRSKSQVALTEEGRSFLVDARRILAMATESIQAVQRLSRGETGQLNIAYLSNFDFELLPETLGLPPDVPARCAEPFRHDSGGTVSRPGSAED
jgi:DNA-binding transcriptional LysR family regulator